MVDSRGHLLPHAKAPSGYLSSPIPPKHVACLRLGNFLLADIGI
jgi:hypothetical protein